jgi:D-alanyl-D-alanine carboxypeptidase/D-alanyl-D-alanine-endopeptidase (penicillin-binding protein 4)
MRKILALLTVLVLPAFAQDPTGPVAGPAASGVAAPGLPGAGAPSPLSQALASLSADPIYTGATVSVQVVNARTGEEVYAYGGDRALMPASTMKLLTAATALRELGPSYRFPTWVMADGPINAEGVLEGNLYIKGQGDPSMVIERMWRMGMDLRLRGVNEVKGNVVFDDSYFADSINVPGWPSKDDLQAGPTYFAPLGALSVNYNIVALNVRPGASVGSQAVVTVEVPSTSIVVENKLVTGSTRSRYWVRLDRRLDDATGRVATFTLTGNVPSDQAPDIFYRALPDPLTNYIAAFQMVTKQQGLKVKGAYKAGPTPPAAKVMFKSESDALAEIVAQMNKLSNNFMAEQLLRAVGAEKYGLPGTTEKGVKAVGAYLSELGVAPTAWRVVNGSGLTRATTIAPSAMDRVLVDMYRNPALATEFVQSLSVGGRDGTLRHRFRDDGMEGRIRGKSGTLDGVRCLAGYVEATDGTTYAFTFLVNDIPGATARAKEAHDRLVLALSGTGGDVADGGGEDAGD